MEETMLLGRGHRGQAGAGAPEERPLGMSISWEPLPLDSQGAGHLWGFVTQQHPCSVACGPRLPP